MALVQDYPSLVNAITTTSHRTDLLAYVDILIQSAQEEIQNDVFDLNFGNGIRFMENAYGPFSITGGVAPVPSDWLSPKTFQVSDGGGDTFPLEFISATELYNTYPVRQAYGLPAYIARDVMAPASFVGSLTAGVLTVTSINSGTLVTGMVLSDGGGNLMETVVGATVITAQLSGTTGGVGTYSVNTTATVTSETITGGGSIFVFGPYPDSSYLLTGTYYQAAALLTGQNPTNWMVLNCPGLLTAACMVEVGKFLENDTLIARWAQVYQKRLQSLVDADKAERWAPATMAIGLA
jgi:hypothetical protein